MNIADPDKIIIDKMRAAGIAEPTIATFLGAVHKVVAGDRGLLPESLIDSISSLPCLEDVPLANSDGQSALLRQLAIIKLNGGLGTGMGLDRVKSLITVKGADTFLDFVARQVFHLRGNGVRREPAFYLMDSIATQADTLEYLGKYPKLAENEALDFLQSMVPKIDAGTFLPVSWPAEPELEWCPPGHGDLYPSILGSGLLDRLLSRGIKFLFVSNSDNLGATVDPQLLSYFANSELSFMMEVATRTAADRKGGHLARRKSDGRLLLRESAQCPKTDEPLFQDIERHRYFNTNNLWVRLDHLKTMLDHNGGVFALPLITNTKTVDPRDPSSPKVLQLESAMGAAIECFDQTGAIVVPRTRFAPVKTTSDLLALRSDAYHVTDDFRLELVESRHGQPPLVELDPQHYKVLAGFEACFSQGVPSLIDCEVIKITGKMVFDAGVVCQGRVEFCNIRTETGRVIAGTYRDVKVEI